MLVDDEPIKFGKNVIETLSSGMYDNPLFLFREYIQNAADSIDKAERDGLLKRGNGQVEVHVNKSDRRIDFEDNGTGIRKDDVNRLLLSIGASQKDRKVNKGFRGIGRLGGLGYCEKVCFETSYKGESEKSILEWDAKALHAIIADKDDNVHAGDLIKRITNTGTASCHSSKHFFKVSLINVDESNDDILDEVEIRKYLSMVAPVPFDYSKFPFVENIERFISEQGIPQLHEYRINLNGDEIRKGYESPLEDGDGRSRKILGVECKTLQKNGQIFGWYWYGITQFESALPRKCWQRGLRLRKANIQIGEEDCLSNRKRGSELWREDRGNNYYIGEVHILHTDLIPNSRRDYFNPGVMQKDLEELLQIEFLNLHSYYRTASELRSAGDAIKKANSVKEEFEVKERKGEFFDQKEREKARVSVDAALERAKQAEKKIEKIENKASSMEQTPLVQVVGAIKATISTKLPKGRTFEPQFHPKKGYVKDDIRGDTKKILQMVFEVLDKMLPEDEAIFIRDAIIKRVTRK